MIKIKSRYMLLAYLLLAVCTIGLAVFFFVCFDGIVFSGIAGGFLAMAFCSLLAVGSFVNYIVIDKGLIVVNDYPFLGSKRNLKNSQLQTANSCIMLDEIESFEIVSLTKEEKKQYIGQKHIFSKYLKFKIKNSDENKYIYVSVYTKKQIDYLLKILSGENTDKIINKN